MRRAAELRRSNDFVRRALVIIYAILHTTGINLDESAKRDAEAVQPQRAVDLLKSPQKKTLRYYPI